MSRAPFIHVNIIYINAEYYYDLNSARSVRSSRNRQLWGYRSFNLWERFCNMFDVSHYCDVTIFDRPIFNLSPHHVRYERIRRFGFDCHCSNNFANAEGGRAGRYVWFFRNQAWNYSNMFGSRFLYNLWIIHLILLPNVALHILCLRNWIFDERRQDEEISRTLPTSCTP